MKKLIANSGDQSVYDIIEHDGYTAHVTMLNPINTGGKHAGISFAGEVIGLRDGVLFFGVDIYSLKAAFQSVISTYRYMTRRGGAERRRLSSVTEPRFDVAILACVADPDHRHPGWNALSIIIDTLPEKSTDHAITDNLRKSVVASSATRGPAAVEGKDVESWPMTTVLPLYGEVGPDENGKTLVDGRSINLGGFWIEPEAYINWTKLPDARLHGFAAYLLWECYGDESDGAMGVKRRWLPSTDLGELTEYHIDLMQGESTLDARSLIVRPSLDHRNFYSWKFLTDISPSDILTEEEVTEWLGTSSFTKQYRTDISMRQLIRDGFIEVRGRRNEAFEPPKEIDIDVFETSFSIAKDWRTITVGKSHIWDVEIRVNPNLLPEDLELIENEEDGISIRFPEDSTPEAERLSRHFQNDSVLQKSQQKEAFLKWYHEQFAQGKKPSKADSYKWGADQKPKIAQRPILRFRKALPDEMKNTAGGGDR